MFSQTGPRNKKKSKITKIRKERRKITTDLSKIRRIIREDKKQLYSNKVDNLDKMDKFTEKLELSKLIQEEAEYLNTPITSKEIESAILKRFFNLPGMRGLHW